jgi:ADP-ribosylation factor-binding protein GGA
MQSEGITQPIEIHGVVKGQADKVKVRWKASYRSGGEPRQDQGEVPPLGIQ